MDDSDNTLIKANEKNESIMKIKLGEKDSEIKNELQQKERLSTQNESLKEELADLTKEYNSKITFIEELEAKLKGDTMEEEE